MRLLEYTPLALRTEKKNELLTGKELMFFRLGHALLGITSEISEVKDTSESPDLFEEYGDLWWYLNLGCDSVECTLDDIDGDLIITADLDPIDQIVIQQGIIADKLKRAVYYGKEFEIDEVKDALAVIKINLIAACDEINEEVEEVLDGNIRKLSARYPDLKFDSERALNRNLDKEKSALG